MSVKEENQLAKRNVIVLIFAQAILGSQMPMIFTVGGLAGQSLASNACFATLPISMIVLGSMITASPLSNLMQKFGRKFGFFIGAIGGFTGGIIGAIGLATGSFYIFLVLTSYPFALCLLILSISAGVNKPNLYLLLVLIISFSLAEGFFAPATYFIGTPFLVLGTLANFLLKFFLGYGFFNFYPFLLDVLQFS